MNNIKAENEKINKAQNDTLYSLKNTINYSLETTIGRIQFDLNGTKWWVDNVRDYLDSWNSFMGDVLGGNQYEWRMNNEYHEKYLVDGINFERPKNSNNEFEGFIRFFYKFN